MCLKVLKSLRQTWRPCTDSYSSWSHHCCHGSTFIITSGGLLMLTHSRNYCFDVSAAAEKGRESSVWRECWGQLQQMSPMCYSVISDSEESTGSIEGKKGESCTHPKHGNGIYSLHKMTQCCCTDKALPER